MKKESHEENNLDEYLFDLKQKFNRTSYISGTVTTPRTYFDENDQCFYSLFWVGLFEVGMMGSCTVVRYLVLVVIYL